MRKFYVVIILSLLLSACFHGHDDIEISYHDSPAEYTMEVIYHPDDADEVDAYLDHTIGHHHSSSFRNTRIDGHVSWDDRGVFYMKKNPGHLVIRMDKDRNSRGMYHDLKKVCQGIKSVVTN